MVRTKKNLKKISSGADSSVKKILTFQEKLPEIIRRLKSESNLGMILIDPTKISRIEHEYGKIVYTDVIKALWKIIGNMAGKQIRNDDVVTINHVGGDQFYIFLSKKRQERTFHSGDIETVAERVSQHINKEMFSAVFPLLKKRPKIDVGYAIMIYNPLIQEERQLAKLVDDAKIMANYLEFRYLMRNKEKLQEIIIKEEVHTIYQPIVNLVSQKILGYEALTRGPKGTEYENPYVLFNIAEETDLLFELDSLCRKRALINAKGLPSDKKVFVNILPSTIHDPDFKGKYLKSFLKDIRINPTNIVLEISERLAIENYDLFKKATKYYSDLGLAIAIDDTGTGCSNLQSLVEIQIGYIKLDISLIRNIDKDDLRKEIVKAMIQIGNNIKSKVIAEGIETKEELKVLMGLGLKYGQGFLFSRPAPAFVEIGPIEID